MSLLKYRDEERRENGEASLSFSRAKIDKAPFRGSAPLLKDEEYDQLAERVYDVDAKVFDLSNPEDLAEFKDVFDRATNQWYQILDYDKRWVTDPETQQVKMYIYMVWGKPYMQIDQAQAHNMIGMSQVPTLPMGQDISQAY